MKFYDFEYDGLRLSDFGFIICSFDSDGINTISSGSQLSFNTVSFQHGAKQELTNVEYDGCIEATFQICKNTCGEDVMEISFDEYRDLFRWLNRKSYRKFKLLEDDYLNIYLEASFNISRIEFNGVLYGLELELKSNRPFALHETEVINLKIIKENDIKTISSDSDEEGYVYPYTEITINSDGNLDIFNELEDRHTYIANCKSGEIITMDYPVIKSSLDSHKIQNDFNWNFLRIVNTYKDNRNRFTISIPCDIRIQYNPTVKFGF